jgi:bacillithiol biosynthesis cysteine-adding enzyme BshC
MANPMECHCIRAAEVPQTTALNAAYLENFGAISEFYAYSPVFESVRQVAGQIHFHPAQRGQIAEVLRSENRRFSTDPSVEAAINRLVSGAVAIVSGQQVGLFSGPSYTVYKALTALRLAEELSSVGIPAVAIFWLATEDHDLAEINHTFWPTRNGPEKLEIPTEGSGEGSRVGKLLLGDSVVNLVRRATELLEGSGTDKIARALEESYLPTETYGSAFGTLISRLFAGRGLILLDPLSPELHRLAAPLYRASLEQHEGLRIDLLARGKALEQAGYHAQVKITERNTLLFISVDGKRLPLRARDHGFVLGTRFLSLKEVLARLDESPESFSPNVLLRPVAQDALLPTAAYVAGPAEIAYFAQASVAYQRLLGRMPVIMPRASITLVNSRVARLLRKYGLEFTDVLRGRRYLRESMERALLPKALMRRFDGGEKTLQKLLKGLRTPLSRLDATLAGALDTSERKMLYQFAKLRGKAGRSVAQRTAVLDAHENEIAGWLVPFGELQERSLCFLPTLAEQGEGLLDDLARRITPGGTQHQVLYL